MLPTIVLVKAAAVTNVNLILEAMGSYPPNNIASPFGPGDELNPPDYLEPPTYFGMMEPMTLAQENTFKAMAHEQDLPALPPGVVWGEDGVISALDAVEALSDENVLVFSAAGIITGPTQNAFVTKTLEILGLWPVTPPT